MICLKHNYHGDQSCPSCDGEEAAHKAFGASPSGEKEQSIHAVDDGFGNAWQCRHSLPAGRCLMQVVRPGKCQCECDGGVPALVDALLDARSATPEIEALQRQIGYLATLLMVRGDTRTLPDIVFEAVNATADKGKSGVQK